MQRKLLAVFFTLAMLACTYGTIPHFLSLKDNGAPKAAHGNLDLSGWPFAEGPVKLDGEWEFYPDRLLGAGDFAGLTPEWIRVPGSWSERMDTLGKATYRLHVRVRDEDAVYGLKTLSIQMSSRIIVNGKVVGQSGSPGGEGPYTAKNKSYDSYFTLKPGLNEVIVQVANYDYPASGGINHSIFLGHQQQIAGLRSDALAYDWATFISFLIMGIYFIGLYTQRRNDRFLLIFGFLCCFLALYSATRGERILYEIFETMPVWLFLRIQFLSTIGSGAGLLLYVYLAFRPFCSKRLIQAGLAVGVLLAAMIFGAFSLVYKEFMQPVTTIYATFPFIYAMYVFVLAALHKVEGSFYLVVAAIALNVFAFFQNLNVYFAVPVYTFPPIMPFLFLLMLALLMSLRFSNDFKQVEKLSNRLIRADRLKDEFLTKTAHEFKTPLHGMINIAQTMADDGKTTLTAEQREHLTLISTTAKRLSQLVYDILDFSRLKQGELTVQPAPIDVRSNVEVILRVFSFMIAGKPLRLVNGVPEHLPYALADEDRFRQIISNLLDNAIKYSESGSIEVTAAVSGSMIEVAVKDTGIGIAENELPLIFEPFKSLKPDSNQSFGLGLPIVKQLVELQKGEIRVDSRLGAGTTFTFSLPVARRDGSAKTGAAALPASPGYSFPTPYVSEHKGTQTILAVDDYFSNLKVLIDSLERLGYTVIAVKNGYEALEQLEKNAAIDMVILDLMMPGLSGLEVCRAIRKKHGVLEMPVLMVTASIQPEDKIAAFEAGANDFLSKPLDAAELRARVKSMLVMKESVGKAVDLEVAFLQSQIKPHFLYNVLNTIIGLSYTEVDKARKLITDLGDYLRGSFQFSNTHKAVPFRSELALIRSYTEIEQTRFKDRIRLEFDIAEAVYGIQLPPLVVQPLVENAIRHGLASRMTGGTVRVTAYEDKGFYCIEIEDDGVGMTPEQLQDVLDYERTGRGVGLKNINKRLKIAYGTQLGLVSEAGVGTKATIRIPAAL